MKVPACFSKIEKFNSERSSKRALWLSILSMVSWIVGCAPCAQSSTGESSVQLAITAAFTAGASSATPTRRYRRSVPRLREIGTFASGFKLLPLSQRVRLPQCYHQPAKLQKHCSPNYHVPSWPTAVLDAFKTFGNTAASHPFCRSHRKRHGNAGMAVGKPPPPIGCRHQHRHALPRQHLVLAKHRNHQP